MTIADRIRKKRESLGMSQEELALKMGYANRSAVSSIEAAGDVLTKKKIEKVAIALKCTPDYLEGRVENELEILKTQDFGHVLDFSFKSGIPLKDLMGGREVEPCDYVGNNRVYEVMKKYDTRMGIKSTKNDIPDYDKEFVELIDLFSKANKEQRNAVLTILRSFQN